MPAHSPTMDWLDRPGALLHGRGTGAIGRDKQVMRNSRLQMLPMGWRRASIRWRLLPVVVVLSLGFGGAAAARDLTVALNDMLAPTALREAFIRPFVDATGITVDVQSWDSLPAVGGVADGDLRRRLEAQAPWDVVSAGGAAVHGACEAGLLEKLDWAALGGRERMLEGGASECGLGLGLRGTILTWDRDKLQGIPGWVEFGDVVKLPGRRGLRKGPRGTLEIALMADGVPPGDVYRLLRTDAGVDRAFRRLDQLRPYIVWWQDEVEAVRLLASGEVLMTSAPHVAVAEANRLDGRNFALQWAGGVTTVVAFAVVKGAANAEAAGRLLRFAADGKVQARLPAFVPYGPLARGALEGVAPEVLLALPTSPVALPAVLRSDEAFWHENLAKLARRFDAWLPR